MKSTRVLLTAMAMLPLAACGGDSSTSPNSITGTYVLKTVNGESLPAVIVSGVDTAVVMSDSVVLNANLTYSRAVVDSLKNAELPATAYRHTSSGTYAITEDTVITFTNTSTQTSVTAKLVNGVATISDVEDGFNVTGVFDKQ
jgi:hypothetical protein